MNYLLSRWKGIQGYLINEVYNPTLTVVIAFFSSAVTHGGWIFSVHFVTKNVFSLEKHYITKQKKADIITCNIGILMTNPEITSQV